tara:strand:- start:982 stop:1920 length:939 start_codon:yes stop_codon:yes gene_type:complete
MLLFRVLVTTRGPPWLRPLADARCILIGCAAEPVSKRLARKAAQREAFVAGRAARRTAKKEARSVAREASQVAWEALSEEERSLRMRAAAEARRERAAALPLAELPTSAAAPVCVIDLGFGELQTARETRSLAQQLLFCYSANKQAARSDGAWPLCLHLSSYSAASALGEQLGAIQGSDTWPVTRHAASFLDAYDPSRLVYLSADATEPLGELDAGKVYVIGGLVDRNRHKGLAQQRALAAGVATARLPLDEHLEIDAKVRRVLAVNHVFEMLLHRARGFEWADAMLRAMPSRLGASRRREDQRSEGQEGVE